MRYFIFNDRRIPKLAISGYKIQSSTVNTPICILIVIRGKQEIVTFDNPVQAIEARQELDRSFPDFVKVGGWYLRKSVVREYKPVSTSTSHYIDFKTSKFGSIKTRFLTEEEMKAELLALDQLFDVE